MRKLIVPAMAFFALSCWTPAIGDESAFQPGQQIESSNGLNAACLTQDDLNRYDTANQFCATSFGTAEECKTTQSLVSSGVCIPIHATFRVIAVDKDDNLIQVSPIEDTSKTYWAHPDTFSPAN